MDLNLKAISEMDGKIEFSKDGAIVIPFRVLINAKIHEEDDLTKEDAITFGEFITDMLEECLEDFCEEIEYVFRHKDDKPETQTWDDKNDWIQFSIFLS